MEFESYITATAAAAERAENQRRAAAYSRRVAWQRREAHARHIWLIGAVVWMAALAAVMLTMPVRSEEPQEAESAITAELLANAPAIQPAVTADKPSLYKIENCTVSHYCICEKCCGKAPSDPAYGVTASGVVATPGVTVAVDPAVIPLGSTVWADYGDGVRHAYRAEDTGGGVKGDHIDLCVAGHQDALKLGVKTATVYSIPQEG